ncbi:MAG: hypothetical protein JNM84_09375, partial [Planctomycetes bacterium]|nr:hypothetical protein [Planctomycetota bacterium]
MLRNPGLFLLILCSGLATAPAQEPAPSYVPRVLTSAQALRDIDILRRALETIHPGLERYWSREERLALFAAWEARATRGAIDELELLREVAVGLARVRCGHTRVEAPQRLDEWREQTPTHLPFTFRLFDGRMFVDRVAESAPALSRGDEILALDGRATSEL